MDSGVGLYQFVKVSEHLLPLNILLLDWGKIMHSVKPDLVIYTFQTLYVQAYIYTFWL